MNRWSEWDKVGVVWKLRTFGARKSSFRLEGASRWGLKGAQLLSNRSQWTDGRNVTNLVSYESWEPLVEHEKNLFRLEGASRWGLKGVQLLSNRSQWTDGRNETNLVWYETWELLEHEKVHSASKALLGGGWKGHNCYLTVPSEPMVRMSQSWCGMKAENLWNTKKNYSASKALLGGGWKGHNCYLTVPSEPMVRMSQSWCAMKAENLWNTKKIY